MFSCPSKQQANCEEVKPTKGNSDLVTVLKIMTLIYQYQ